MFLPLWALQKIGLLRYRALNDERSGCAMNSPLVTTIITTYRRPRLLRRAIRSALNQTMPRVRVCVYDDRSDDETADVVRR